MKAVELSLRKLFYFHVLVHIRERMKFSIPCHDNAVYICEYIDNKIKRNHCSICALERVDMAFHVGRVKRGWKEIMVGLCG